MDIFLSHAKENTANQKPGKPLHILRYAMRTRAIFPPVVVRRAYRQKSLKTSR